jgi:hypothetical protein
MSGHLLEHHCSIAAAMQGCAHGMVWDAEVNVRRSCLTQCIGDRESFAKFVRVNCKGILP